MNTLHSRKVIYSVLSVLACLGTLIYSTVAWVSHNKVVDSFGLSIQAGALVQDAVIESFPVTQINGTIFTYDTSKESSTLPLFDRYQIEHTEYEKALVVHIQFQSTSSGEIALTAVANSDKFPQASTWFNMNSGYISDVLRIQLANVTDTGKVQTAGSSKQFVTKDSEGSFTKSQELLLLPNDLVTEAVTKDIYLILSYNMDAVNFIFDHSNSEITYNNDIMFRIDSKGGQK